MKTIKASGVSHIASMHEDFHNQDRAYKPSISFLEGSEAMLKAAWESCYQELCGCIRNDGKSGIVRHELRRELRKQYETARDEYLEAHEQTQGAIFDEVNT